MPITNIYLTLITDVSIEVGVICMDKAHKTTSFDFAIPLTFPIEIFCTKHTIYNIYNI